MAAGLPIRFQELFQLQSIDGLTPKAFTFATCSLQSDKYICVREVYNNQPHVFVIDVTRPTQPDKYPISADSAIMNPEKKIVALKAGQQLQIFDLEERRKVKDHVLNDQVGFWKWISANTIALVTNTAVYHWSIEGVAGPEKVFDRLPSLEGTQIINYRTDSTQTWLLLIGIKPEEGRIVGAMQLYSVEKKISQPLEGHAAAFTKYTNPGETTPSILFSFVSRTATSAKLYILEVGKTPETSKFQKKAVEFLFPKEAQGDFPVAMETSEKFNSIYMITKLGYLYVFDLSSGKTIYMNRISAATIFTTVRHNAVNGILGVNTNGQVLSVSIEENNIVPYIVKTLNDIPLAISVASKCNLPGAEELFIRQFSNSLAAGDYQGAARVAAESPGNILRNMQTIQRFKACPAAPNQPSPLLQYFSILLEKGKLNSLESLELARPVLQQGRGQLLEQWLNQDKLECSEELGDLARQFDMKLALNVYFRAGAHQKVVMCFVETGQFDKIVAYSQRTGFQPEWGYLLQNCLSMNPAMAVPFATMILQTENAAEKIDINSIIDTFLNRGMVPEVTSLLLDFLKGDKPEHAQLQTRLLEINLLHAPQVADAIMGNEMFTRYDRQHIGQLCEKAGLYQRALEHYVDIHDIKRCLLNTHAIPPDFIVGYFSKLSKEDSLEVLNSMLKANRAQNMQICVSVATKYSETLTPAALIELFQNNDAWEGMYYYLAQLVTFSQEEEVHFKYIEAAVRTNQLQDVERIVRESNYYNPERVKEFLKSQKISDQVPLVIVCDRFNFVDDLTQYLYKNNLNRYIEVYVSKVNPSQTPVVVGSLLDVDCNEDYIRHLVKLVGAQCPVNELVAEVEKRNRLKLIFSWLEERVAEGNVEPATHNALAKIYIDSNRDPDSFLTTNQFYDSKEIGKYCESRDPHLSVIAYKRGQCDLELVDVTNRNGLFRQQARYVVERQDPDLWAHVLQETNEYRRSLIDQVVQTALPESKLPEEVSSTVKAFMTADLPNELIELLEKIVLESSEFAGNRNLQNLLILTAIKADKARVMDYVNRLDNYNASDIANIALHSELHEEAFAIFKKFNHNVQAIEVLIDHLNNIERAYDWAERVNEPEVYSKLGRAQLNRKMVKEAIDSFTKSDDPQYFGDVIAAAEAEGMYEHLVRYLQMCRKKLKEPQIETALIWAWANCKQLADLEEFIAGPNCANIQVVGDKCFNAGLYEAAKILFNNISNFSRLATTLVKLKEFSAGVDAARKANSQRTWKEVNRVCVDEGEFRLAQICGLHIIVHADELENLIQFYESKGHFNELLQLVEAGLALERAHVGMFTELAILYSKYKPEKLMEHLRLYYTRMNIPKVLRACERNQQWPELTFLYIHYDEHDNAALTMISHPVEAWDHTLFKEVIPKVASLEICYKAIEFYLQEHPLMTTDLLKTLTSRVDHSRVVTLVRKLGHLAVIKPYLISVQDENIASVNAALHDLYIEEEDFENLRHSIGKYSNFDSLELALRLEKHEMLEFRRIAAELFRNNKRYAQSLELSKKDLLWKDAIDTVAASHSIVLVSELLQFFVNEGRKDCFAACLFTCYDFVAPDVALELAWRHGMIDFAMPFMIQTIRDYSARIQTLEQKTAQLGGIENPVEAVPVPIVPPVQAGFYPPPPLGGGVPTPFQKF